ncbi:HD family phosphohydrolase [Fischerella thermalis]|uniref:HD family phosphohydrolase n=1 Tax=Fischerella thermalis TaxID=372787 RepID=UPI000C809AB8|nr:HD family phosphohydrolase [Fischerella thermalis]MBF1989791.1 HD family phosphohydrolase [Fischerella thermalis M58_A2018_009]MBF2059672.1 HD family phosphohydrolase [Fischerella thermalis M66_A2018_004]MBF2068739.1 HD family phosphohydrolase [Fischerella thermalis M48_A2018_028]PLZ94016.1 phosphohydrolase [Fischerella thermalis CCMEE 5194]
MKGKHKKQRAPKPKVNSGSLPGKPSPVVFVIAVVSLTGIIGQNFYNQPQLKIGTTAPETIRAPYSSLIEDTKKTEAQRRNVSKKFVPVLMVDENINKKIKKNLQTLLAQGNEIRSAAGSFPFFDTFVLSVSSQGYLRSCADSEWEDLLVALEHNNQQKSGVLTQNLRSIFIKTREQNQNANKQRVGDTENVSVPSRLGIPISSSSKSETSLLSVSSTPEVKPNDSFQSAEFAQAMAELEAYRLKTSTQNLVSLLGKVAQARQGYTQAIIKLSQLLSENPQTAYETTSFLNFSDEDWAKTQMGVQLSAERILAQGIPQGLPPSVLQNALNLHMRNLVPQPAESFAKKLLLEVLEPNLKQDEEQTKIQAAIAAAEVKPVIVAVEQGEVIIRKGDRITSWHLDVLEHYHLLRREINWLGLMYLAGTVSFSIGIFTFVERSIKYRWRHSDRLLVLLLTLSTPLVVTMGTPYTTWSGVGLLLGSFYGATAGVTVVGLLVALLGMSLEISKISLLAGAAGGILGSCMAHRLRSREELALLSVAIALTEGGVYLLIQIFLGAAFGPYFYVVLKEAGIFALSALAWSIVALGLSPYLEKLFDLVTPIRLAELANPNRPLLKKLATVAPGTFQHTLFVATLAEAAAKELGCNIELVRAGTLYHDIGKMHDPQAFIENQMGGTNKHDTEIKDPWHSADIIKKHVSEGLVMAKKHSLPSSIQAFIPEHQGTMQIAYFYHQAQQMAKEDPSLTVDEADFRYDGPIPQSRETGIVMLADSCEAALRSLKDASCEQALVMVNNILRARWQDNQLVDSGLTREEMSRIAEIFVEVWQQFHHKRIAYPKLKAGN